MEKTWKKNKLVSYKTQKYRKAIILLAPSLIILGILTLIPMIYTLYISLFEYKLSKGPRPTRFVGLHNYILAFTDGDFWRTVIITIIYTLLSVIPTIFVGLLVARLLQKKSRFHSFLKLFLIFPYAVSPSVKGYLWRFMLQPDGAVDKLLDFLFPFCADFNWLANGPASLFFLSTTESWGWIPMIALMFLGAMGNISPEVYEAAAMDGVKSGKMFKYITFPLIKPVIITTTILKAIFSLKMFDTVVTMTGGGPGTATQTLNFYIYRQAFEVTNMGYASALSVIVIIIVTIFVGIYVRRMNRGE